MILSVTLNPCVDHVLFLDGLKLHDTNRVIRTERDAGGKGVNMSRVVAELGGETVATGFLGGATGGFVRMVLDLQGIPHRYVEVAGETRTNFNIEDGTEQPPTTVNERGPTISLETLAELLAMCDELARDASWLVLGGSLPPGVPEDVFYQIATRFCRSGCKVVVDADGPPMVHAMKACPHLIKPNAKEAARLLGRPCETLQDSSAAALELYQRSNSAGDGEDRIVIISRGEHGAIFVCRDGVFEGISPEVEANSTIGSGDSMIAGVLWALEEGKPLEEAFRYGLAAGAATATTNGAEIARRPVIEALLPKAQVRKLQGLGARVEGRG